MRTSPWPPAVRRAHRCWAAARRGTFAATVAFSADGRYLVAGAFSGAYVWRMPGFVALPVFQALVGPNLSVGGSFAMRAEISAGRRITRPSSPAR